MGLSASGKTTLARLLAGALANRGLQVEVLDGEQIRTSRHKELGFTREDRETHLKRLAQLAARLHRQGKVVVVAAICPYHAIQEKVRAEIGEFVQVYLQCPLAVCCRRDPKGLYRRALAGEINNFTGIHDPFDPPLRPEIVVNTDQESPEASLARILLGLKTLKRL
jgi:adenylyl-sulfate kinase